MATSHLKLNRHLHVVFLDGVYATAPDGSPRVQGSSSIVDH
jgi:hypothetical protein